MRWFGKVISVAVVAVFLSAMAAYADDDAAASSSDSHTVVVQAQGGSNVSWYEITVSGNVPQEIVAYDAAGDELARQANPAVSGQAVDWCPLLQQAIQQCDACAEVAANSGC